MNISSCLRTTALGLALSSVAYAQSPPAPGPTAPNAQAPMSPAPGAPSQLPVVTQSSRVRAFNPGPGGEVRSLYLQNGSVVDLAPTLGSQLGPEVRKGEKITVTGTKSEINGQSMVEAASVRMNDRTFSANTASTTPRGPGALTEGAAPPPAPSPQRRGKAAIATPRGASADAPPPPPDFGGAPPPPNGMAPPPAPPDGMVPPPPPLN